PNNLDAHWLQPQIVIEVDFAELTTDGYVRHGVYLGRREDKVAASVSDEKPKASPHIKDRVIDGITITHGDREIFPAAEITKHDLASFYHAAGERLLKVAGERPLSLMRCPRGVPGQ